VVGQIRRLAVHHENLVFFVVLEVGQPFHDQIHGPEPALAGVVDETLRGLRTNEVGQALLVIQCILGGVGDDFLLFGRIRVRPWLAGQSHRRR